MCGIVGLISKNGVLSYYANDLFTNMLRMDSLRGPDSTGCFGVMSDGHVDMLKGDADGWLFTTTKDYSEFYKRIDRNYKVVIGHNRKATSGKVTPHNAHPFQHQNIMMVHNGAIKNSKGIAETEVDSEAIAHALAKHDPAIALNKLDGAYAIVWWDGKDRTISLARNKERPLFLLEYPFFYAIASEPGLPMWLNGREGRKAEKVTEVPTEKIWTFDLDQLSKGYTEVAYEEYKHYTPYKPPTTYVAKPIYSGGGSNVSNIFPKADEKIDPRPRTGAPVKAGDEIQFVLHDEKMESGAQVVIGHYFEDGVVDENIFVRTVLGKGDDVNRYFGIGPNAIKAERWKAKVHNVRPMAGFWTIYVGNISPVEVVVDSQENEHTTQDAEAAIADGCSRCRGPMTLADVKKGILRRRAPTGGGGYRVVCPTCLETSLKQAQDRKPYLTRVQ